MSRWPGPVELCPWSSDGQPCPRCGSEETVETGPGVPQGHPTLCAACGAEFFLVCVGWA